MQIPKFKRVSAIPANVDNTFVFLKDPATNGVSVYYEDQNVNYPIQGSDELGNCLQERNTLVWCDNLAIYNVLKPNLAGDCLVWINNSGTNGELFFHDGATNNLNMTPLKGAV